MFRRRRSDDGRHVVLGQCERRSLGRRCRRGRCRRGPTVTERGKTRDAAAGDHDDDAGDDRDAPTERLRLRLLRTTQEMLWICRRAHGAGSPAITVGVMAVTRATALVVTLVSSAA